MKKLLLILLVCALMIACSQNTEQKLPDDMPVIDFEVTRSISGEGSSMTVELSVSGVTEETYLIMEDNIPEGWRIETIGGEPNTGAPDTFKKVIIKGVTGENVEDTTYTYTVVGSGAGEISGAFQTDEMVSTSPIKGQSSLG